MIGMVAFGFFIDDEVVFRLHWLIVNSLVTTEKKKQKKLCSHKKV